MIFTIEWEKHCVFLIQSKVNIVHNWLSHLSCNGQTFECSRLSSLYESFEFFKWKTWIVGFSHLYFFLWPAQSNSHYWTEISTIGKNMGQFVLGFQDRQCMSFHRLKDKVNLHVVTPLHVESLQLSESLSWQHSWPAESSPSHKSANYVQDSRNDALCANHLHMLSLFGRSCRPHSSQHSGRWVQIFPAQRRCKCHINPD